MKDANISVSVFAVCCCDLDYHMQLYHPAIKHV